MKHLLVHLPTFPRRAPDFVLDYGLALAELLTARISATVVTVTRPRPNPTLARYLDLLEIIETQERTSIYHARYLSAALAERAQARAIACEIETASAIARDVPKLLVERMRASDLAITPFVGEQDGQPHLLESMIFDGGRPVLVVPREPPRTAAFGEIVVGWDDGRAAARALGDAMPLLRAAKRVRVVMVDEPAKIKPGAGVERLARHLATHGIDALCETIESEMRPIGQRLMAHAQSHGADLLVMGAFGHTRLRDFLLGSATSSVLADPILPILLSH